MATAIVPPIYDPHLADWNIDMATERAYAMAMWLGRHQGLLIGVSAAAAVAASLEVAEAEHNAGREATIVHNSLRRRRQVPLGALLVRPQLLQTSTSRIN